MNLSTSHFNQPNATAEYQQQHASTIAWALLCSILLHVIFAVAIPKFNVEKVTKPEVLEIQLVAKPQAPTPMVEPEPIKPAEPTPTVKPTPTLKPLPIPVIKVAPVADVTPEYTAPPADVVPTPKIEPQVTAITNPEPPKDFVPSQADIATAKDAYGDALWRAISKFKKYPNVARTRGYQGEVILGLELDGYGKIKSKKILQSSGYEMLDNQALEMVDKAVPLPLPAEALRNSNFNITIPVPFKLESP